MEGEHAVAARDVEQAAERLRGHVRRTPVERSPALATRVGGDVWLKCECWQETGSFKLRGALNRLLTLDGPARARGVVTASAGNHALGVAEAATRLGVRATVVVPETASPAKLHALERYSRPTPAGDDAEGEGSGPPSPAHGRGGWGVRAAPIDLVRAGADYDAAEAHGLALARESGRTWVSAYNDPAVIAGNGTICLEALADVPDADVLVVPVGGGGLIAGVALWARHTRPGVRVVGVQPERSATLHASLAAGRLVTVPVGDTLADGLAGNIEDGSITFPLAQRLVDEVVLVSEAEIAGAMRWLLAEHHLLVEGSAAAAAAALLAGRVAGIAGRRTVVLLTGRNVAFETLRAVMAAAPG